ncbi:septum site-determining protein MinC [Rhodoblastus acidophilus]|uniref:septum site-determining protein MinC n=1 Tax=Rhodoblastus acidophilus TaxID=1074 RepID=UPI0022254486|nr:septum site-determining protein MinC [Rhodoblastus acidophilus]MCW2284481.1 septum site-determining protein MinC [Rhodoblastus acidophilus]MCW2333328.1 septum site-determining protein MinC [Rhodoblastus acidophilus]
MNAHVRSTNTLNLRTHSLIAFVLQPVEPLEDWLVVLDGWLSRSPNFFANKPIILDLLLLDIPLRAYRDFLSQLTRRHIRVMGVENPNPALVGPHLPPTVTGGVPTKPEQAEEGDAPQAEAQTQAEARPQAQTLERHSGCSQTLFIDSPVRSGQSISNLAGDITIIGRVASGAEIIAGGSVHVYGAVQGRIFAGVSGIPDARIFCTEARAELLCVGGAYVTAEGMDPKTEGKSIEVRLAETDLAIRILN